MTTHELETGQTLIVGVVPRTATDITHNLPYKNHLVYYLPEGIITKGKYKGKAYRRAYFIELPDCVVPGSGSPIKIVGTIQYKGPEHFFNSPWWRDLGFESPDECISRLASWGYYWDNPLGPTCPQMAYFTDTEAQFNDGHAAMEAWQEAESRKLSVEQMVVLILIKK